MTHERAHVRPGRPGLVVPDPDHSGAPLPPDGLEVVLSTYWLRRIRSGDVIRDPAPRPVESDRPRAHKAEKH